MNRPVRPLHLVERAAQRLRGGIGSGPESALLPEDAARPLAEGGAAAPSAEPLASPVGRTLAVEHLEAAGMITTREQRDRIAEEFRIVGQQVLANMATVEGPNAQRNLVMVTSARPGEGKTFTALNLAASLSLGRERSVVLVDADIQAGSVSVFLGLEAETGLLDIAGSPMQLAETAIVRSRIEALSVLPVGGGTDPKGRALVSAHYPIAGLAATLARRFTDRLFIVDAPSCLSSSDAAALAAVAGQILLVVEAEKTRRGEIEAALDLLDGCADIRLVLNKIRFSRRDSFGNYS
jgi:protein-tyrosine kinase